MEWCGAVGFNEVVSTHFIKKEGDEQSGVSDHVDDDTNFWLDLFIILLL